ncbi:hypothetical protein HYS99_01310 [Candidatus Giovannonibacteria bacterium]|nr:hypothetical protein [Candidatus Giovannonibacteria bacterium]
MKKFDKKSIQLKPTTQKVLLLLLGGLSLALSSSPKNYFTILNNIAKDWERINRHALHRAIRNLYVSRLIKAKDNPDGTVTMILSEKGRKIALRYDIDNLRIPEMKKWDKKWRLILFDVPEKHKKARNALSFALKKAGCFQFQKSVFIHPFECKNEIDFIIEFFLLRPYVRFILAETLDNELDVKRYFNL